MRSHRPGAAASEHRRTRTCSTSSDDDRMASILFVMLKSLTRTLT
jgi:hypothetical protein